MQRIATESRSGHSTRGGRNDHRGLPPVSTCLVPIALALGIGFALGLPRSFAEPPAVAAKRFLQSEAGLVKLASGNQWVLPEQLALQRRYSRLEHGKEAIQALTKQLAERVEQNRQRWTTHGPALEQLRKAASKLGTSDPKRKPLDQQIRLLESQMVAPQKLGAVPEIRDALIELTNQRQRLALSILWIRRHTPHLIAAYERLRNDREVAEALRQLGDGSRLRSAHDFRRDLKRLTEFEPWAFPNWVPLYWQSGQLRFGAIIGEGIPATFSWTSGSDPAVVTWSLAESAGITIPPDAPEREMRFGSRRRLTTRRVVIPQLRIANHVFHDVQVYVLPPEGEDLGSRLSPAALSAYHISAEPEHLRLTIHSTAP